MLDKVIEDLVREVEALNGEQVGSPGWVRQQALSFGLSMLRSAKANDIKEPVDLDKFRKHRRANLALLPDAEAVVAVPEIIKPAEARIP